MLPSLFLLSMDNVVFLKEKPHHGGFINSIIFMPWGDLCFVTGGSEHAVILWRTDEEGSWKPRTVHTEEHSNVVTGVAGLQYGKTILSSGKDKLIVQYDAEANQSQSKYKLDSKCKSVLPNPSDANLFMVQVGAYEKQLRLFDIRTNENELHGFGWKQESCDPKVAVTSQGWSSDGLYISSGSEGSRVHIFDIRYNSCWPSQSLQAHHSNRVFKAVWHPSLLISASTAGEIELHRIS